MLDRIRHRRARRRAQQRLELAPLADLVAQGAARAAAHHGSDEALFLSLLGCGAIGRGWCAVLRLAGRHVAAHVGVGGVRAGWIGRGGVGAVGGGGALLLGVVGC